MRKIAIIGGGAAGMAAAIFAAGEGVQVHLFEQNEKLGKKLFITGKGRCNFTNACETEELFSNVVTNSRFLYSAFDGFTNAQVIAWMEQLGVKTKVERGNRAFPASDHSSDIIRALEKRMKELGVVIHLKSKVTEILTEPVTEDPTETSAHASGTTDDAAEPVVLDKWAKKALAKKKAKKKSLRVTGLLLENGAKIACDAVLVATGGASYPTTGSRGDGYRFAEELGHTVKTIRPALVPMETEEDYVTALQGLSLRNVTLTIPYGKKKEFHEFGEMLFTHFGISGPLALSASSYVGAALEEGPLHAEIDLKPALSEEQLDARILREFDESKNREFKNAIAPLFPSKLRPIMVKLSGIPENKQVHEVTKEERAALIRLIKAFPFTITGLRSLNEAIITQGGVNVKEVNPSTLESRLVEHLFFAGEVLDLDAVTGGFNLQIAWSTAHSAAETMHTLCSDGEEKEKS